jgi:hypothetical protein
MKALILTLLALGVIFANSTGMAETPYWSQEYPATADCKMLLHFNESSGTTTIDSSGIGNDAVVYDSGDPEWGPGKFGNALWFDGITDNLGLDATRVLTKLEGDTWTELTIEMWVYFSPSGHRCDLIHWGNDTAEAAESWVYFNRDWTLHMEVGMREVAGQSFNRKWGTLIVDNTLGWVHLAFTYKAIDFGDTTPGGRFRFYVNGILDVADTWTSGGNGGIYIGDSTDFMIGHNSFNPIEFGWAANRMHRGWIDEVRVCDREIEFEPFPNKVGVVPLPVASIKFFYPSDGWTNSVLWQDDEVTYPNKIGCQVFDGTTQYTIAEAEAAGMISGTLYGFDSASQSYKSVPGTGGDFISPDRGYFIWSYVPDLELLLPVDYSLFESQ